MNLQPNLESSIYQTIQELEPSLQPLVVSRATLKSLIGTFFDLLSQRQLLAQIWVKLPETDDWFEEIERYQQQGYIETIYLCSNSPHDSQSLPKIIPVELQANSQINRESFLIILSGQFCSLILIQQQTDDPLLINLFCIFNPELIEIALKLIKQTIVSPDFQESLLDSNYLSSFSYSSELSCLINLLIKQSEHRENLKLNSSPKETPVKEIATTPSAPTVVKLTEAIYFQDEFLNHLVRELLPPITKMKTALRLLESKQLKPNQRQRYLELLQGECDRQNSLVAGLLELVQICRSSELVLLQSSKLEELIPGIVSICQPLANEKGIQLGYTINPHIPPVSCPSSWLKQILFSLLNNSLKFTTANGRVFVKASLQNKNVEILVSDTGCGIEAADIPKIFDPFFRGKAVANEETVSAGLGLTIAKQLLLRCGGSISATSRLGRGTTFRILLPVVLH